MTRRLGLALLLTLLVALFPAAGASAAEPPWCGTPEADAAENLPDGTDPSDPAGSFPHIPYYAVGCTLEDVVERSNGRASLEVIGQSALGRPLYSVVINDLRTRRQQRDYLNWRSVRRAALEDPARAQRLLDAFGGEVKMPVFIQGGIHGNEYEGVDAAVDLIERLALTPRGADPEVDAILDHLVVVVNPIQNPDGRVAGTRANGFGFDLNRDYLTQAQSETRASIELMQEWLAPEALDLHGYVSPTLVEGTTKPHNPSVEYDLWLKWNQPRLDANEAALEAIGRDTTRPINDWCAEGDGPGDDGLCDDGQPPGPAVAEGWDDWGPFYTAMYAQQIGLDASTVEMCTPSLNAQGQPNDPQCGGREGSRDTLTAVVDSTLDFVVPNRVGMLRDMLEIYRRGEVDAPRPECCPPPFDVDNNWMQEYPQAYVIPLGEGQRSDAEANRLVEWLLFNDIEVSELGRDVRYGGRTFERRSYVVHMAQPRRGLADTALSLGVDISERINQLYAAPAAWSHGFLWGADTVSIPDGARLNARTDEIRRPNRLRGGVENGRANAYALELDSPTAVRALNDLLGDDVDAGLLLEAFRGAPAGTAVFDARTATRRALDAAGREYGLDFLALRGRVPELDPIERVPRIAVLTGVINQDVWSLRSLGFTADPVSTATIDSAPTDPLAGYDVIFSAVGYPSEAAATGRARLQAFFAGGGGYIGAGANGARFAADAGLAAGLAPGLSSGGGRSGIVYWDNTGGEDSVITGAYPPRDTMIVDPPTWLSTVPAGLRVDARLPQANFFAAGLWPGSASTTAPGSALVAHGESTSGTARLTVFANNPLYRADPEREWPMVGSAAYWGAGD